MMSQGVGINVMDRLRVNSPDRRNAWKEEKERKLAKLKQLRAEREKRRQEQLAKEAQEAAARASNAPRNDQDLDKMLSDLGVAPLSEVLSSMSSMSSEPGADQTGSPDKSLEANATASPRTPRHYKESIKCEEDTLGDHQHHQHHQCCSINKKPPQLSVVSVQATNIPPRETVTYTKGVQTSASGDGHG
ncbi:Cytoplasmic dynein 1 intermediate chain-like [Homarus americanus]|uniref:Cytoplasmic dynein 1 intermediate chain-like n=1 Tax=Homarus americanus TaxID=6706 RepID=A0A8J5JFR7_HOMAM|nr:Cytoplasmic dynein 1 intermediate chain-like [Homarus americanus]